MTRPLALLVCGSREWKDAAAVVEVLKGYPGNTLLVHGGARGADGIASVYWASRMRPQIAIEYFGHLGKRGGIARNRVMIALLRALSEFGEYDVRVEAFDLGTPGTGNMVALANRDGFNVRVHGPKS